MRRMKPQRYIPKDSRAVEHPEGLGVVYVSESVNHAGKTLYCAVAYHGKANHADFNYYYPTAEARQQKIDGFFKGLDSHAKLKAERRKQTQEENNRGYTDSGNLRSYNLAGTSKLIKGILSQAFPNTKFSVRSESYSGGSSIDVHWTDGPTTKQVDPIIKRFEGASFDGMIDLKFYNDPSEWNGRRVEFAPDYVFSARSNSYEALFEAADWVAYHTGTRRLEIKREHGGYIDMSGGCARVPFSFFIGDDGAPGLAHCSWKDESLLDLINRYLHSRSYEAATAQPELPAFVTDAYIDETVAKMVM